MSDFAVYANGTRVIIHGSAHGVTLSFRVSGACYVEYYVAWNKDEDRLAQWLDEGELEPEGDMVGMRWISPIKMKEV